MAISLALSVAAVAPKPLVDSYLPPTIDSASAWNGGQFCGGLHSTQTKASTTDSQSKYYLYNHWPSGPEYYQEMFSWNVAAYVVGYNKSGEWRKSATGQYRGKSNCTAKINGVTRLPWRYGKSHYWQSQYKLCFSIGVGPLSANLSCKTVRDSAWTISYDYWSWSGNNWWSWRSKHCSKPAALDRSHQVLLRS